MWPLPARPEAMDALQWRLLGVLGATVLVNHYDFALLTLALPEIQHGLGVAEEVGPLTRQELYKIGVVRADAQPFQEVRALGQWTPEALQGDERPDTATRLLAAGQARAAGEAAAASDGEPA